MIIVPKIQKQVFLFYILFFFSLINNTYSQTKIFLDAKGNPISEQEFSIAAKSQRYIVGENDSLGIKKLVANRVEEGKTNAKKIYAAMAAQFESNSIDTLKPLLIIYYPGKVGSNPSKEFSEEANKRWRKNHEDIETQVQKIKKSSILYVCKTLVDSNETVHNWNQDPQGIIEKEFFKYLYPGLSFVIITPSNNYISFFGEFATETIVDCLKKIKKKR